MRDLTRAELDELIRLLDLLVENGRGAMGPGMAPLPRQARLEVMGLVHAAERVREACVLDRMNQEGG